MKSSTYGMVIASAYALIISFGIAGVMLSGPPIVQSIVKHKDPTLTDKQVISHASTIQSIGMAILAFFSLLFLAFLGRLSDFYGRKPVIVSSGVMLFASTLMTLVAYYLHSIPCYFASMVFMICQGLAMVAGMAYVTDLCEGEADKSTNFGMIVAASVLGVVGGSFLVGWLAEKGMYFALITLLSVSVANIVFIVVFLRGVPPSTTKKGQKMSRQEFISALNPFRAFSLLFTTNAILTCNIFAYAIYIMASSDSNVSYLYTEYRYGWKNEMNGVQTAVNSLSTVVWQVLGVRYAKKYISEEWSLTFVLLISAAINVLYGIATEGWMFMVVSAVGGITTIFVPWSQTQMSNQVEASDQGALFGGIITVNFIAQFLGDLSLENTFSLCMSNWYFTCPGTPFYIGAVLMLIAFLICLALYLRFPPKQGQEHKYVQINSLDTDA